jgi:hypothetical protein
LLTGAQGKAAWQDRERERERRVSITEAATNHRMKATEAHRRWMKRNRVSPCHVLGNGYSPRNQKFFHGSSGICGRRSVYRKKVKIKIYRTIILSVVLYGCETWSLTLRDENRLRMFENRVLRRILGTR